LEVSKSNSNNVQPTYGVQRKHYTLARQTAASCHLRRFTLVSGAQSGGTRYRPKAHTPEKRARSLLTSKGRRQRRDAGTHASHQCNRVPKVQGGARRWEVACLWRLLGGLVLQCSLSTSRLGRPQDRVRDHRHRARESTSRARRKRTGQREKKFEEGHRCS